MGREVRERLSYVPRLYWSAEETAARLGISTSTLTELRKMPLYKPDAVRPGAGRKLLPLWSDKLLEFIAFSWSLTAQGVRRYTDEEAYEIWKEMQESTNQEYLQKAGMV